MTTPAGSMCRPPLAGGRVANRFWRGLLGGLEIGVGQSETCFGRCGLFGLHAGITEQSDEELRLLVGLRVIIALETENGRAAARVLGSGGEKGTAAIISATLLHKCSKGSNATLEVDPAPRSMCLSR